MIKPDKRSFSFEFKLKVVQRFMASETKIERWSEPGATASSDHRGLGPYLARPIFGDPFTSGPTHANRPMAAAT